MEQYDGPAGRSVGSRTRASPSQARVLAHQTQVASGLESLPQIRERRTQTARSPERARSRAVLSALVMSGVSIRMRLSWMVDGRVCVLVILVVMMVEQKMALALVRVPPFPRRPAEREGLDQGDDEHQDLAQALGTRAHRVASS